MESERSGPRRRQGHAGGHRSPLRRGAARRLVGHPTILVTYSTRQQYKGRPVSRGRWRLGLASTSREGQLRPALSRPPYARLLPAQLHQHHTHHSHSPTRPHPSSSAPSTSRRPSPHLDHVRRRSSARPGRPAQATGQRRLQEARLCPGKGPLPAVRLPSPSPPFSTSSTNLDSPSPPLRYRAWDTFQDITYLNNLAGEFASLPLAPVSYS